MFSEGQYCQRTAGRKKWRRRNRTHNLPRSRFNNSSDENVSGEGSRGALPRRGNACLEGCVWPAGGEVVFEVMKAAGVLQAPLRITKKTKKLSILQRLLLKSCTCLENGGQECTQSHHCRRGRIRYREFYNAKLSAGLFGSLLVMSLHVVKFSEEEKTKARTRRREKTRLDPAIYIQLPKDEYSCVRDLIYVCLSVYLSLYLSRPNITVDSSCHRTNIHVCIF